MSVGVSDFEALKSAIRWHPQSLIFCAFDLLHLNGKDLRNAPLLERRARLKELIPTEHPFLFSEEFTETPPPSSEPALITSLRGSFPNSLRQNTEAGGVRPGLRRNASLKALCLSSAPRVIERQKLAGVAGSG
jgi:ATP-dependent DNA ligase